MCRVLIALLFISYFSSQAQNLRKIGELKKTLETASGQRQTEVLSKLAIELAHDSLEAYKYLYQLRKKAERNENIKDMALFHLTQGNVFRENFDHARAKVAFEKADSIYKLYGDSQGQLRVRTNLGSSLAKEREYSLALSEYYKGLKHFKPNHDSLDLYKLYNNIGYCHYGLGNSDSSIYYFFKLIPYCEENPTTFCSEVYNHFGIVYSEIGERDKSIIYHTLSLKIKTLDQDTLKMASSYLNIAGAYFFQNEFDSCARHLQRAIDLYAKTGNLQGEVLCNNNLAAIYNETKQYDKVITPSSRALKIARQINDQFTWAGSYQNMAEAYHGMGQNQLALIYTDSALQISKKINSKYLLQQHFDLTSRIYQNIGQYHKAYEEREFYHIYKDSIFNESKSKQIATLEAQFENTKKEKEISEQAIHIREQELVIEQNRIMQYAFGAVCLMILTLGYSLFNRRRLKQSAAFELERRLLKEQQLSAIIDSQEKERSRFAKDLHDGFGQLISTLRLNIARIEDKDLISQEIVGKSYEILDQMYISLKNVAFDLMPQTLVEKGLVDAVLELSKQVNDSGKIKINVTSNDQNSRLGQSQKLALYRIIQEITNNIIKYASAKQIDIGITELGDELIIMIEDDGQGFDPNTLFHGKGNGWRNITSRMNILDGHIDFDSIPNRQGTTIAITVPMRSEAMTAA